MRPGEDDFVAAVLRNPHVAEILRRAAALGLPGWYLAAGCLFQSVWNVLEGKDPERGINDYDLIYFDDTDLSWNAEDLVIRRCADAFADLPVDVEVRNQARVHLWFEQHFGTPCPPLRSSEDAIDRYAAHACRVGIRLTEGHYGVYAPSGFDDLFDFVVRPNPVIASRDVYESKAARWFRLWPCLEVMPWPEDTSIDRQRAAERERWPMEAPDRAVAPDGSPVVLYRTIPGDAEAALIHNAIPAESSILELGCGAGRVTRHLAALGHAVTGVDNSGDMLAHLAGIDGVEGVLADITTLDLEPRRWPVVLAASHLVNDELGPAFLAAAARHLEPGGCVLVQRHEPGWIDAAEDSTRQLDGLTATIRVLDRPGPGVVTAAMVYELEGSRFEQPFTAYEVDDERLADLADSIGCIVDAVLDDRRTWVRLRRH